MASLILLSVLPCALAANNSYFSLPEISYSTPSGRPGSSNLNKVDFNITDAAHGGHAECAVSFPSDQSGPTSDDPATCSDPSFHWYFGTSPVINDFDITVKHKVPGKGCVRGQSPRYTTQSAGATYECGGSGACFFWVGSAESPLKIYFD